MAEVKSKYLGHTFNGRWKYIGNHTFENIYNGKQFTTTGSNCHHVFIGRTTIDKLITYTISGKKYNNRTKFQSIYCIKMKRRIGE